MLDRQLPVEPVARATELGAFTHTDSWRVLRIQGEFVEGIDALAEIGAAVSVFGSARFGGVDTRCTPRPGGWADCWPRRASP